MQGAAISQDPFLAYSCGFDSWRLLESEICLSKDKSESDSRRRHLLRTSRCPLRPRKDLELL
ncbi:hypothetical protein SAY86_006262 [Trapa natans]|uniref:Uncharacterized protein n=1 Tax=Trapa natans TaxID=22666 RepID=A0AAN7L698_TRANT|nr:hypothetical protein SAY86_006262 [Trapa natans]